MGKPTRSEPCKIQHSPTSAVFQPEHLSSAPTCTVGCTGLKAGTGPEREHLPLLRSSLFIFFGGQILWGEFSIPTITTSSWGHPD